MRKQRRLLAFNKQQRLQLLCDGRDTDNILLSLDSDWSTIYQGFADRLGISGKRSLLL